MKNEKYELPKIRNNLQVNQKMLGIENKLFMISRYIKKNNKNN
jgi:hypothetical protein